MIAIHYLLHRYALLLCTYGNGYAVLIATANEYYFAVLQSQIAHVDVGRHVNACKVSDVHAAISVWQSGSNGCSLIVFLFHLIPRACHIVAGFLFVYKLVKSFFCNLKFVPRYFSRTTLLEASSSGVP